MRCSSAIQARQLVFGAITQPPPHSDDPLVERVIRASVNGAAGIVLVLQPQLTFVMREGMWDNGLNTI